MLAQAQIRTPCVLRAPCTRRSARRPLAAAPALCAVGTRDEAAGGSGSSPGGSAPLPAPEAVAASPHQEDVAESQQQTAPTQRSPLAARQQSGAHASGSGSGGSGGRTSNVRKRASASGAAASGSSWAARLAELAEAAQKTGVRLRRQLEPPPPGFPPGPAGDAAVQMLQQPLEFLEAARREYGGVVGLLLGGERVVLVADPAAARTVLLEPPGRSPPFVKQGTAFFPGTSLTGNGLLTSDGEVWRRQRRLVNPAFRRTAVDKYAEAMLSATDRMLRLRWRDGWARDIYADFNRLTLEITLEALFGGGGGSQALAASEITSAIQEAFAFFARRGAAALAIPEWVPTPDNVGFTSAVRRLDAAVYGLIAERRRELAELAAQQAGHEGQGTATEAPPARDLLDSLLLAASEEGEGMGDGAARDELMTLLVAGQETSAILLGWACAYLAHHPEVQQAAAAEVRALLRGSQTSGIGGSGGEAGGGGASRPLEAADSRRLPFVEAVVLEAMRLSPPAYLVGRCAAEDTQLAGYPLEKGTTVLVSPYLLHREPSVWGPDAASFRPLRWLELQRRQQAQQGGERGGQGAAAAAPAGEAAGAAGGCPFSGGASEPAGTKPEAAGGADEFSDVAGGYSMALLSGLGPNSAYVPFGAGQRNCVGTGFAMTEAILVLAAALDRFTLRPLPGAPPPQPQPQITLRPASVRLLLRRRWD